MEKVLDLRELLLKAREEYGQQPAFLVRNKDSYDEISFNSFVDDCFKLAKVLKDKGYSNSIISLIGENSYEWIVCYMATVAISSTIVPIDKELPANEVLNLINQSNSRLIFYSSEYKDTIKDLRGEFKGEMVVIGRKGKNIADISYQELISECNSSYEENVKYVTETKIDPTAMCSMVFTSGTTGMCKGVMLSHNNHLANMYACDNEIRLGKRVFALLPFHHTYPFMGILICISIGSATAINNSIKYISQNFKIFKPTDALIVPLVSEALYNQMWSTIRQSGKEKLVKLMIKVSSFLADRGIDIRRKLFSKIHEALGGELINIFCGGALVDKFIAQGFIDFGFKFHIGYGITECSPLITANTQQRRDRMGTCGTEINCCNVKIDSDDQHKEGEILVKGTNVMLGYYNNPKATEEAIVDGWFKTGDIGKFTDDNFLIITGRIKNIIVLKNGKNVYPEELESYIYRIPYVKETLVCSSEQNYGDETSIEAQIYLNEDRIVEDGITIDEAKKRVEKSIDDINKDIAYYKRISRVIFQEHEFEKTTTKKIKRNYGK